MMMKSLRLLKKRLTDAEISFTDSIGNALWLLPDGSMIDGEFDCGSRGQDHRVIESGIKGLDRYDGAKFWNSCHYDYKLVRLCPESDVALVAKRQKLTAEQKYILNQTSFQIEIY
jgi:hypothetical protein